MIFGLKLRVCFPLIVSLRPLDYTFPLKHPLELCSLAKQEPVAFRGDRCLRLDKKKRSVFFQNALLIVL